MLVWDFPSRAYGELPRLVEHATTMIAGKTPLSFAECASLKIQNGDLCAPYVHYSR
jgi:hypothetical protein